MRKRNSRKGGIRCGVRGKWGEERVGVEGGNRKSRRRGEIGEGTGKEKKKRINKTWKREKTGKDERVDGE